jgi:hypothetical protein
MSDEQTVTLDYAGSPVTVVELEREVRDGDVLEDVPEKLAGRLLHTTGFSLADGHSISEEMLPLDQQEGYEPPAPFASGYRLEDLEIDQRVGRGEITAEEAEALKLQRRNVDPTAPVDVDEAVASAPDTGEGPLTDRTNDQLQALAKVSGGELDAKATKAELVEAIEAAG